MKSSEIRKKFLDFFKSKGHEIVPSDSLVPKTDPTLLFTSAGMNQFKEKFLGHNITYKRLASSQKCLRTGDLEKVGKTPSHHTFFEMLGNFSFGDYFKKEAIEWAWEFMTEVMGLKEEELSVSVYKEDGESYKIWRDVIKVPEKKIAKLGADENFWPSNAPKNGPNGPCGPCSEIFYNWEDGTSVEVWNLVFTQFDRKDKGRLDPLPNKNIDTGMGLERLASVMQRVKTNFETDLFVPIIKELKTHDPRLKTSDLNAIADHIRAATFAICDGVAPSNEERGYVIRKLIRRAYLRSGANKPFLYNIVPTAVSIMKDAYPELAAKREEIALIVKEEEGRFGHTLEVAMPILEEDFRNAKAAELKGEKIFKLVDTYGLPVEVIESEAQRRKIKLDTDSFNKLMDQRRELSRKKSKIEEDIFGMDIFTKAPRPEYSANIPLKAEILRMALAKGKRQDEFIKQVIKGDKVSILTSPQSNKFYTEAGGQVGDTGIIKTSDGNIAARILNTRNLDGRVIHDCIIESQLAEGIEVIVELDNERKRNIARNHTATHLLQSALRQVLGEHVHQAGSLVAPDRLRFDFTHMKKLTDREIEKVETIVNDYIKKDIDVKKEERSLDKAQKEGAIALFGEKYGDRVTVVSAGDFSKEVCGGTHVDNTKDIGLFKIMRESSVASGVRRIEAFTDEKAREWIMENEKLKMENEKLLKEQEKQRALAKKRLKEAEANIDILIEKAKDINGVKVIIEKVKNANMGILRDLSDKIKSKTKSAFVFLESVEDGKVNMVLTGTKDLISKGFNASEIIKPAANIVDGSGGGRADFAQAGGKDPSKLSEVFEFIEKTATDIIGGISK